MTYTGILNTETVTRLKLLYEIFFGNKEQDITYDEIINQFLDLFENNQVILMEKSKD